MKFIMFMEWKPEEASKAVEKLVQAQAQMKEHPERFPKAISETFAMGGEEKGFTLVEMDNQDQLANLRFAYLPVIKCQFVPLQDLSRILELARVQQIIP